VLDHLALCRRQVFGAAKIRLDFANKLLRRAVGWAAVAEALERQQVARPAPPIVGEILVGLIAGNPMPPRPCCLCLPFRLLA
jgi:hypothetical protein